MISGIKKELPGGIILTWPLSREHFWISSRYGIRRGDMHHGIDMAALSGTPVHAAADGTVLFAGTRNGYGNCIIIHHGGNVVTKYAHLKKIFTTAGATVHRNTIIGLVGATGRTRGKHDASHLHFEVIIDNCSYDPLNYLVWYTSP